MVQFEFDHDREVYRIKIPTKLAGENFMLEVGEIEIDIDSKLPSKDAHIELFTKVPVKSLRNILLNWDEYLYQLNRQQEETWKGKNDGDRTDK